jgi:hypothetical protein
MSSIEDRVRAAATAAADTIREVPPLPSVPASGRTSPRSRWQPWFIPLTAAAAVVVVAIALVTVHLTGKGPAPSSVVPSSKVNEGAGPVCGGPRVPADAGARALLPGVVPKYFVELCAGTGGKGTLVAADTSTGAVLGSVAAPSGRYMVSGIFGAAGDRVFVISASHPSSTGPQTAWWMLRLAPGTAHPVHYTPLRWTLANMPMSIAVSPDGTEVAAALNAQVDGGLEPIRVYSVATGAVLHSWTINGLVDALQWEGDGKALVYQFNSSQLWRHDIAAPGSSFSAHSTLLLTIGNSPSAPCIGASDWQVSATGTTVACNEVTGISQLMPPAPGQPKCTSHGRVHIEFVRLAAGGRRVGTDYSAATTCVSQADSATIWWASADGKVVIGAVTYPGHSQVGAFYNHTFVPLPDLGTGPSSQLTIAW